MHEHSSNVAFATGWHSSRQLTQSGATGGSSTDRTPLRAVSLWPDRDSDQVRLDDCGCYDTDGDDIVLRIPLSRWEDSDTPTDVDGWQVTATTEHDEHHHGEVAETTYLSGAVKLTLTPIIVPTP